MSLFTENITIHDSVSLLLLSMFVTTCLVPWEMSLVEWTVNQVVNVTHHGRHRRPPFLASDSCPCFVRVQATVPATLTQEYLFMPQQMKTCFVVQVCFSRCGAATRYRWGNNPYRAAVGCIVHYAEKNAPEINASLRRSLTPPVYICWWLYGTYPLAC